ncbi:MAG: ABC transporter substrate-binding protein [Alsobacter sp.]
MKRMLAAAAFMIMSSTVAGTSWAQATNSNQLSDPRVRQAIAYAVDMDTIIKTLFASKAVKAVGLLPNGPFKSPDLNPYAFNPDKARKLLADAGWDKNRELDLVYYYDDQLTVDFLTAVQAYLADVGIKIKFRLLTGDTNAALLPVPKDPVNGPSAVTWDLGYGAKAALALQEYYNGMKTGNSAHTPGSKELDKLIEGINATADVEKQKEAFFAIEKYANEKLDTIPLYYQQLYVYESDRLNRNGHSYGNDQYNYDWGLVDWTVSPEKNGEKVLYTNTAPEEFFELPWYQLGINITNKAAFDRILVADGTLTKFKGQLAESFKVSEDGMTVSFTLRDGLKWHDGSPLTADDVVWSIVTAIRTPGVNSTVANTVASIAGAADVAAGKAQQVSGISVDGRTITLKFATLDPNVLLSLSQFAPLPKKHLEKVDPATIQQNAFWQRPVGSGPYKIADVKMNSFTTFVPFEGYYGGKAKIDKIVAFPSGDGDGNVVKNAAARKLDYGFTKNTADVGALEAMPFMKLTAENIPYTRLLWINHYPRAK